MNSVQASFNNLDTAFRFSFRMTIVALMMREWVRNSGCGYSKVEEHCDDSREGGDQRSLL